MKYGFIGCGNMGGAIAKALSQSTRDIVLTDRSGKGRQLAETLGIRYGSLDEAAGCQRIFLGVKPQQMAAVLEQLQPILQKNKPVLISMAAGLEVNSICAMAGGNIPVIRIMPNTPVAVGKGVILYCCNNLVTEDVLADTLNDLTFAGLLDRVDESWMDAACCVSGCGPAYAYMFLEALAQGGINWGVPKEQALQYAAATLSGAAQMVMETGEDPLSLRDKVCSPGGSTIEGVKVLDSHSFRETVTDCIAAAYRRNKELGK